MLTVFAFQSLSKFSILRLQTDGGCFVSMQKSVEIKAMIKNKYFNLFATPYLILNTVTVGGLAFKNLVTIIVLSV